GEDGHTRALVHAVQSLLQQQCLARSRRADEVHTQNPLLAIAFPQLLGENLVLVQDFLLNFNSAHSSTSMYAMSKSSPLMHCVANSPHCGHSGSKSTMRNSCWHLGQRCTRGIDSISSATRSHSVSFTMHSKPNWREPTSTPASSPILTPTLVMRTPGCRRASACTQSRMEDAMPNSCMIAVASAQPVIVALRASRVSVMRDTSRHCTRLHATIAHASRLPAQNRTLQVLFRRSAT